MSQNPDDNQQGNSLEDIDAAAKARGTTRAKIQQELVSGSQQNVTQNNSSTGQNTSNQEENFGQQPLGSQQPQDGYSETQGAGYGQSQNTVGQPADATQAQAGYDPTHSGVRHAQNQPGTRPPTPGRETGTSWGEDQQMGTTTDTPDRKNPAG